MPMLLWNLPRDAFFDVVHEVRRQLMGGADVGFDMLCQLLGGNVRALMDLAMNYGWDLRTWLRNVVNHIRDLMYREVVILNFT